MTANALTSLLKTIASEDGENCDEAVAALVAAYPWLDDGAWANYVPADGYAWATPKQAREMADAILASSSRRQAEARS